MNLVGRVLVVLLISALIIALLPLNALAQIVKTVPKEEQAASKPLIWHADYHLNYLTLYPGAQGLGGEFTYSGSGGENSGVSVVVNWRLLAGGTRGPIDVFINYVGEPGNFVFLRRFYGGVGSLHFFPSWEEHLKSGYTMQVHTISLLVEPYRCGIPKMFLKTEGII